MKLGKSLSIGSLLVILALVGCGGGSKPKTPQCTLNSDCMKLSTPGLVCALGYCVKQCNASSDCPNNERCVNIGSGGADAATSDGGMSLVAEGTNCEAPELSTCNYNSQCQPPLVCSTDLQCRAQCQANVDCAMGQVCTSMSHLCADPTLDKDYNAVINDFVVNDAGMGIPQGGNHGSGNGGTPGSGGHGGGGGGGAGGAAGGSSVSDGGVASCPSTPQTTFGLPAVGDSNLGFTSGVGVRTANQLLIFSGYTGPRPSGLDAGATEDAGADAAVPSINVIYVQAFDPVSGAKAGPATPLFQAADGAAFGVEDVSIAPTGEIVLLHGSNQRNESYQDALYASFFSPTSPGAAVQLVRTIQIESAQLGNPHATWTALNGAFALSWKYYTSNWYATVKKFHANGTQAGGDTTVVPSPLGNQNPPSIDDGHVGTAGDFLGVATVNPVFAYSFPSLTVLDGSGNQVGGYTTLSSTLEANPWVTVGGTKHGFVNLFRSGNIVYEVFAPTSGDAGVTVGKPDGGDAGMATLAGFSFPSTSSHAHAINDDTGGAGGVGVVLLDTDGANVVYVNADGVTHQLTDGVISSASGAEAAITNYHGSFGVSLYSSSSTNHSTQMVASACN
jgi:hypothetical protein